MWPEQHSGRELPAPRSQMLARGDIYLSYGWLKSLAVMHNPMRVDYHPVKAIKIIDKRQTAVDTKHEYGR